MIDNILGGLFGAIIVFLITFILVGPLVLSIVSLFYGNVLNAILLFIAQILLWGLS